MTSNSELGSSDTPTQDQRAWLDLQYSPSKTARDPEGAAARWRDGTVAARNAHAEGRWIHVSHGSGLHSASEIFLPVDEAPSPMIAFIHGGWWQEGSIDVSAAPATTFTSAGIAWASLGYTLAPQATLGQIIAEIGHALGKVIEASGGRVDPTRIVLAGHSAGAHLAASHAIRVHSGASRVAVQGLLLVSGAYDLGPVQKSYVNDAVQMSPEEAEALSPALQERPRDIEAVIAVGLEEGEEFVRNARTLRSVWSDMAATTELLEIEGRDHFDILDELAADSGVLFRRAVAMSALRRAR